MTYPLSTGAACRHFHVSRGTLAKWRERGIIRAFNANPGRERAVWRYAEQLEVVGDLEMEMKWRDLKRRCGR